MLKFLITLLNRKNISCDLPQFHKKKEICFIHTLKKFFFFVSIEKKNGWLKIDRIKKWTSLTYKNYITELLVVLALNFSFKN